ncbi:MAG: aldo/keto reductase [Alphaproteobacteria bacterium]|nr:aldo/keto reductase [Alphaproteobacteria bacterium]
MSLATRRRVGRTKLELPVFGFGAAHIGELYAKVPETEAVATLAAAWDNGVRYYDTAAWYGRGLSEHRLGGMLRTKPREQFALTTKVGRTLSRPENPGTFDRSPWVGGLNFEVTFDYGYDGIMRSYEQALQRLAIDSVDALVIHDLDALFHEAHFERHKSDLVATGMKALEELKASGDIAAIGMGVNTSEALEQVATLVDLDFVLVALPYTLLDQSSLNTGMATCLERDVSVVIGAPFASGILVTGSGGEAKYAYAAASEEVQARVRGMEGVCRAHGVTLPAAALQFPLAHPAVVSVIPGAVGAQEVVQNIASLSAPIPAAFWSDLKEQGLIDAEAPVPANGQGI